MKKVEFLSDITNEEFILTKINKKFSFVKYDGVTDMTSLYKIRKKYVVFNSKHVAQNYVIEIQQKKQVIVNNIKLASFITIILFLILGSYLLITKIKVTNHEIRLRETLIAKETICKSFHDMTWKIIKQKAAVTDKHASDFDEIYSHITSNRFNENDSLLFFWIQEKNPTFNIDLYKDLSRSIESLRIGFHKEQEILTDLQRTYNIYIKKFPNRMFLKNISEIKITIITSTKTKDSYETGIDDDISL